MGEERTRSGGGGAGGGGREMRTLVEREPESGVTTQSSTCER